MAEIRICIDAGHYGDENKSTVVTPTYYEAHMAWTLHLMQKEELEKYEGITVITTRKDQKRDLEVYTRGTMARGCTLFLSDHSNWCETERVDRAEVIYPISGKCRDLAERLARKIGELMGTKDPWKTFSKINKAGNADYYGVIRGAAAVSVPGLILEHSFHSNAAAAKWLQSETNLRRLAVAEAEIVAAYYGCRKKGEIDMTVEEVKELIDRSVAEKTEEIKAAAREELDAQLGRYIEHIGDIPHADVQKEVRVLLDCGAINGGTSKKVDPDDIRLPYNLVRVLVMAKRYAEKIAK